MTNLSVVSPDGISENQVIRSNVAKTQQPDAERLKKVYNLKKICLIKCTRTSARVEISYRFLSTVVNFHSDKAVSWETCFPSNCGRYVVCLNP